MRVKSRVRDGVLALLVVAAVAFVQGAGITVPGSHALAFGDNSKGELGVGTTAPVAAPTDVVAAVQLTQIDGGKVVSIGIDARGDVYTWGSNPNPNVTLLGYTAPLNSVQRIPRNVSAPFGSPAISVAAGVQHMLVAVSKGQVWSWGNPGVGLLGRPGGSLPAVIPGLSNITSVSAGAGFSLALDKDFRVYAWGTNATGALGPPAASSNVPRLVPGLPPIVKVSAGYAHALALAHDGTVWAWGKNDHGQSGSASPTPAAPAQIAGLSNIVAIAAGDLVSLALDNSGVVWAWGREDVLGIDATTLGAQPVPQPVKVAGGQPLGGVVSIAAGLGFGLASTGAGVVYTWGLNPGGLGISAPKLSVASPAVSVTVPVSAVSAGFSHGFALVGHPQPHGSWQSPPSTTCAAPFQPTFKLEGLTVGGLGKADVMLVLDGSGSINAQQFTLLKQFATNLVNGLEIGPNDTRVGIAMFDAASHLVLPPSASAPQILNAIGTLTGGGSATCIGCGLDQGENALDIAPRAGASRFIVVVTDGFNNAYNANLYTDPASHLDAAIANAHTETTVVSVGVGTQIDEGELTQIASNLPGQTTVFTTPDFNNLGDLIDDLAGAVAAAGASGVSVTLDIDGAWQVNNATSSATGSAIVRSGNYVTWTLPSLDAQGASLVFNLTPLSGGTHPLLESSIYADAEGHAAVIDEATINVTGCPAFLSLAPVSSTGLTGTNHVVTATLKDDFGVPLAGVPIAFNVMSGPGMSALGNVTTNSSGLAATAYTSASPGTDVLEATLASNPTFRSNQVTRAWQVPNQPPVANAGADQTVNLSGSSQASVKLNGGASTDDGQRGPLTYAWLSNTGVTASGAAPIVLLPRGTHTFALSVNDGDHTRTDSVVITVVDPSGPIIVAAVHGTPGPGGWYSSDVTVTWSATDPESGVGPTSGCEAATIHDDTAARTLTCSTTNGAGVDGSESVTIRRDATPPVIDTPDDISVAQAGSGGTTVNYPAATATDALSGVAGAVLCTPPSGGTFALGATQVTCTAHDIAGNTGTAAFTVTVTDATPPVITAATTGTPGTNGWFTSAVEIVWTVSDPESPVTTTGCGTISVVEDGVRTLVCSATSAGGTSTHSVTVRRDVTAPVVIAPGNVSATAANGTGAIVAYGAATASDATSGVSGAPSCSPASGSTFAAGVTTVTCAIADGAGNSGSATFTVTVTSPAPSDEPGRMHGEGHVLAGNDKVEFDFIVIEGRRGWELGRVELRIKEGRRGRWDDDRFESRTVDEVRFSNAPQYGPGRNSPAGVDTVTFSGTGKWDRKSNYRYVVTASDRGEPGRGRDTFTIEVRTPQGQLVFSGGGTLTNGNVQSSRLWQPFWSWLSRR